MLIRLIMETSTIGGGPIRFLAMVWAEGQVKSVILNRNFEDGYEPFDPFTEMVMEKYLDEKPSFLREKEEE